MDTIFFKTLLCEKTSSRVSFEIVDSVSFWYMYRNIVISSKRAEHSVSMMEFDGKIVIFLTIAEKAHAKY